MATKVFGKYSRPGQVQNAVRIDGAGKPVTADALAPAPAPAAHAAATTTAFAAEEPESADEEEYTLEDICGVGAKRAEALVEAGYDHVEEVAYADAKELSEALKIAESVAQNIIDAADELME